MTVARNGGGFAGTLRTRRERAEMGEDPAGIGASHLRAAIRAQRTRREIRKDDLERCGVSVANLEREVIRWFVERGRSRIAEVMEEIAACLGLAESAPVER
jgi:hypothetical protein